MHIADMPIAVATCGTALVEGHLDLLRRFSERVVLAFDADEAGAGAALRGFEKSVPGDLDLRVAILPEGKDPAEVVAQDGADVLKAAVDASMPLLRFRIESELANFDLSEPEARTRAVRAVAAVIALHPDPVARHEYAVMVTRDTGVETRLIEQAIRSSLQRPTRARQDGPPDIELPDEYADQLKPRTASYAMEAELLRVMLANDESLSDVELRAELFANDDTAVAFDRISKMLSGLPAGQPPDLGSAIGNDESREAAMLRELALDETPLPDPTELVTRLQVSSIESQIVETRSSLQLVDRDADEQGYSELWSQLIALEQDRRTLRSAE
jgi:DNA primase